MRTGRGDRLGNRPFSHISDINLYLRTKFHSNRKNCL